MHQHTRLLDTPEHCGRRPDARKRRTGKTQIFWLEAVGGNTDFDLTDLISNLAAVAALSPRADAALVQAPPTGSTDAAAPKAAPKSAANNKDTLTCCIIVCTRDAGCAQSAKNTS